jgi:hypothetical protein
MCDKLVFDLSQEVEGTPNVFVRKDWVNILDNQNQNYNNNQSIIDTSQLSNSNKYMSYREAYLSIPMLLTFGTANIPELTGSLTDASVANVGLLNPSTDTDSFDYGIGLKNWFGQIVHSFTLDYNGTTIIQQTPYINMWNSFKLMTSLSLNDLSTQGATIGFFPDDPITWGYYDTATITNPGTSAITFANTVKGTIATSGSDSYSGQGVVNNTNFIASNAVNASFNSFGSMKGNDGFLRRQQLINYDQDSATSVGVATNVGTNGNIKAGNSATTLKQFLSNSETVLLWKSYISKKQNESYLLNGATPPVLTTGTAGVIQFSIIATVYLKHLHSFFNMVPLLKGVFMKLTLNLNNTSSTIKVSRDMTAATTALELSGMQCTSVANPLGGVNPIMISSGVDSNGLQAFLTPVAISSAAGASARNILNTYIANLSVGATCLDQTLTSFAGTTIGQGGLSKSVYLYVPAMTFNPTFEQAYLSNSVKQIKYTDVYQYQVLNVASTSTFNNLVTNGIANIKSVLILPFFNANSQPPYANVTSYTTRYGNSNCTNSGFISGVPVFQSPFDPAGTGCTSPLCHPTNFNVQISGQNAIYNTQKYIWEEFNNQLYGQNAVNGGLTDGITSGLIDRQAFDMEYCYYYVNVERMLPVEMSVPKSVQIIGQNLSKRNLDLYVFVEYGVEIQIDALTGARV